MGMFAKHKKAMKSGWKGDSAKRKGGGGFDMPYPIKNGVARLSEVEMDEWDSGDDGVVDILKITGVIVTPSEHKGQKVQVSHFLRESQWRTIEEVYEEMTADLRDVGCDVADLEKLEAEVAAAVKAHKAFTFETFKNKKGKIFCKILGPAKDNDSQKEEKKSETPKPDNKEDYGDDPFA